jgi:hypothetical protein
LLQSGLFCQLRYIKLLSLTILSKEIQSDVVD